MGFIPLGPDGGATTFAEQPSSAPTTTAPPLQPPPPTQGDAPSITSQPTAGAGVALTASGTLPVSAAATGLRLLTADPVGAVNGEFWYRSDTNQFCVQTGGVAKRSAAFT